MDIDKIISIVHGKEPRYTRKGECIRCGTCCKLEECEHFEEESEARCAIHDEADFPERCKLYPSLPPIIFKTCGFSFVDLVDGTELETGKV